VLAAEGAALLARCLIWLAQPLLVLALRSVVRSRAFWQRGLSSAWCPFMPVFPDLVPRQQPGAQLVGIVRAFFCWKTPFLEARRCQQ
jgi:hypothetical protein